MERFAIKIDKSLRANLYKICRLCGIDNPDKIKVRDDANIVNLEDGEPELWKKVFDCIGLMITKDDKMPQFMCTLCVDKINDFFEFREMCYATDGQTRKLLGIKAEPKAKIQTTGSSCSIDFKTEDIKEPIPEVTPLRAGRKRRNADMEITKDIKIDINDDIKPSTTNIVTSATKKKRMKLNNIPETEPKIEPGTKPGPTSKTTPVNLKKEPATKITPKVEPTSKIALSKKRLKTEPIVKEDKKDIKSNPKITKLMRKKLKVEAAATSEAMPDAQQPAKKKKLDLIKMKKLPQVVVKAEKLKKGALDTKIKEEAPVATPSSSLSTVPPAPSSKIKSKCKEKCAICDEGFLNKVHLDKHIKTTHIPTVQRYHCVQCNETLKKNMEIKNHNLWHKLSKTPFKCGKCSETSCSIYTYSKHIRDCNQIAYLDSHIPDWHCPDCSGNYETTYLFNIHSCVSKALVCPGCDKSLKWKEDYFKHIPTCAAAFHRIPPYMTSNIQVKNEAELPSSPVPPLAAMGLSTATTTSATLQSGPSTRITPPQMDSNQCVVIPGNISLHNEGGSASPSKSSRKGKRITKKDLKRFDKLLKSTMTTLVSIKHEPSQGEDPAVVEGDQTLPSEVKEPNEPLPDSPPGSPMPCGGDDFHHNGDDSDSADEQTTTKPVGTIKQEIIDEGYRDLYNNIEVNIKHEVDVNKAPAEEAPQKKTVDTPVSEELALAPKPILKLKITKEHGTLNSILMDSPKSEKKKKKKKRKEDRRSRSPEKEEHIAEDTAPSAAPALPSTVEVIVQNEIPDGKDVAADNVLSVENSPVVSSKTTLSEIVKEPPMPMPEVIQIKKEVIVTETETETETEANEVDEEASSQNTPSIVAASSGSLQISCVSEGVLFHGAGENEEETPQETESSTGEQANLTSEASTNWSEPISSMDLSVPSKDIIPSSIEGPSMQEIEEEIDIKPRLEDLIPMLQIASVASGAEVNEKPISKPVKKKRPPNAPKTDPIPKIVAVSSGSEVAYDTESNNPSEDPEDFNEKVVEPNDNVFDYNQIKIKEEIVDPGYDEENTDTPCQQEADNEQTEEQFEEDEDQAEDDADEDVGDQVEEEAEEQDEEDAEDEAEDQIDEEAEDEIEEQAEEEIIQIKPLISKKQAEENAYIANIDFNNLTIKQEKEYIDDGLENSQAYIEDEEDEANEDDDEEEECSDNDSEETSSEDESDQKSDSESEREYRDLPSEEDENVKDDDPLAATKQVTPLLTDKENETPTTQTSLGLKILTVHSEFSSPKSSKKTESENANSDDKLSSNLTTEDEVIKDKDELAGSTSLRNTDISEGFKTTQTCSKNQPILMDVDGEYQPEQKSISNDGNPLEAFDKDKTMLEIIQKPAIVDESESKHEVEVTNINETPVQRSKEEIESPIKEKSFQKTDKQTTPVKGSEEKASTSNLKELDQSNKPAEIDFHAICTEKAQEKNNLDIAHKTTEEQTDFVDNEESPETSQCNNLDHSIKSPEETEKNSTQATEAAPESPKLSESLIKTSKKSSAADSETTVVAQVCDASEQMAHIPSYTNEDELGSGSQQDYSLESKCLGTILEGGTNQNVYPGVSNAISTIKLLPGGGIVDPNTITTSQPKESKLLDMDMISIEKPYKPHIQSLDQDSSRVNSHTSWVFARQSEITNVASNADGTLPILTDISGSSHQCPTQVVCASTSVDTHDSQTQVQNLCELPPVHDVQHSSFIPTSVQSVMSSHLPDTLNSSLSYSMDDHISFKRGNQPAQQNTLETHPSIIANHTPNVFENTNILMNLGNAVPQSTNHDIQQYNPTPRIPSETLYNIPPPPTPMELQQFNAPGSSYATFNCNNDPQSFTDYQDLTGPTAGQLQTSLVQQLVVNQSNELSSSSLTNLSPVLTEEVQNRLNEDTVAVSNFEFNDNVLRARSSLSGSNVVHPVHPVQPVPIFNDFENLNEIAENNNNANIERELQDELGNVLADAIADRSNDDNVDDDNVINENRANFDIT